MAKLKNTDKIFDLANGQAVTVGHNRTVTRDSKSEFTGRLHGHPVFHIKCATDGKAFVKLDCCGYLTVTTRAAMADFMAAFGISGSASIAGGVLSARAKREGEYVDFVQNGYGVVKFWAERYPE